MNPRNFITQKLLGALQGMAQDRSSSAGLTGSMGRSRRQAKNTETGSLNKAMGVLQTVAGLYAAGRIGVPILKKFFNASFGEAPPSVTPKNVAQPTQEEEITETETVTEESPILSPIGQRLTKGMDLSNLTQNQQKRVQSLLEAAEGAQGDGKKLGKIRNALRNIVQGTGIVEEEATRFESEYPQGEVQKDEVLEEQAEAIATPKEGLQIGDRVKILKRGKDTGESGEILKIDENTGAAVVKQGKLKRALRLDQLRKEQKIDSAPIEDYIFDDKSNTLFVKFRGGKNKPSSIYAYPDFSTKKFVNFAGGRATAKTDGEFEGRRWWKGKNPSLGAAFWKYINKRKNYNFLGEGGEFKDAIYNFLQIGEEDE